ncbi:MAG: PadR family transcriptional regulator [Bacteroidota bacterium]|nr:PadR family transcriptional regulator [Bacteroidota bacterium]
MIETRLGDFEETVMLIVGIMGEEEAYAFRIAKAFEQRTGRAVSIGAIHSTLNRLETKGFVRSSLKNSSSDRGDRRKRIFVITALGKRVLRESMEFKVQLWKEYPAFAGRLS